MGIRIPILRFGGEYHSLTQLPVADLGTGEQLASLSQALDTMIATDCQRLGLLQAALKSLQAIPVRERIKMSVAAANFFEGDTLDCGGVSQTPEDYIAVLARTSGLSFALARANSGRICAALRSTEEIMNGLMRGLPLGILDTGLGVQSGAPVCISPRIDALGVCLPNNSPGVNVIWLVCPAFGIPVLIRPGSSEPFTPLRLIQAFVRAGFPKEAFGYYPCDHSAADRIPQLTGAAIVFGSDATVKKWASNPLVHVHGSGDSKLIIGEDLIDGWESLMPALVKNMRANSGRSCFKVSRFMVPRHGQLIAAALARELGTMIPRPLNDPEAMLSAMAMPEAAAAVNAAIEEGLKLGGAVDMSAPYRKGNRLEVFEGRTYLHPTVVLCDSNNHPLANKEFLFPFAAVTEVPNDVAFAEMGPTLSLAVYTNDGALKERARKSKARLVSVNKGTWELDRRQPHEEDLFSLLWVRKSYVE